MALPSSSTTTATSVTATASPRLEVDPMAQVRDYQDAISFAQTLPEVDKNRIGIWGTSYTGGHLLLVPALDNPVKWLVFPAPAFSGARHIPPAVLAGCIPPLLRPF